MDLKPDDIFNIELDPALLLSYELDKLNLESIPNDIFEFSEEIPKNEVNSDSESNGNTSHEAPDKSVSKLLPDNDKSEIKNEARSRIQKRKKDINGNEKPISDDENLHCLLQELVINEDSESDNETNEDSPLSKLKERAPIRPRRRANRSRDESNILNRNNSNDRSQFDNEKLKFWSGSSQIQFNDASVAVNHFTYNRDLTLNFNRNDSLTTLSSQDSLFEDIRASGVSSPESGYGSSIPGSPPKVSSSVSQSLDFIPETVDERNILDFLTDNSTNCALPYPNLSSSWDLKSKENRDQINETVDEQNFLELLAEETADCALPDPKLSSINGIINFLKDTPVEKNVLVGAAIEPPPSESIHIHVPSVKNDLNTLPVLLSSAATKTGLKSIETPKKIDCKKLDDKAKAALRPFLSKAEILEAESKIYRKIQDNKKDIKVIHIVEETDKGSENRTNLHYAVLRGNVEDIFCLVEIQKQYNIPFKDINIRDKYGKTALDYAIQNKLVVVSDYLKENTACQSVNI